METDRRLSCLLYAHATVLDWLRRDPPQVPAGACLVELATAPRLAHALGLNTPAAYPGLIGTLTAGLAVAALALRKPLLPRPFVPAPGAPTDAALFGWALQRLREGPAAEPLVVLLHVADLAAFEDALGVFDDFAVFWDLRQPVTAAVERALGNLALEGCLADGRWAGWLSHAPAPELANWAGERLAEAGPAVRRGLRHALV